MVLAYSNMNRIKQKANRYITVPSFTHLRAGEKLIDTGFSK